MHRNNTGPAHSGTKTGVLSGVFLVAAMAPGLGSAAWLTCADSIAGNVTDTGGGNNASAACNYSTTFTQDNVNPPLVVNQDSGLFGFEDWSFGIKIDGVTTTSGSWTVGDSTSGLVSVVGATDATGLFEDYDVSLVFKGGNNPLVGYLLNESYAAGVWASPFTDPPFALPGNSTEQAVSHYTYYYRSNPGGGFNPPAQNPVPAPLALIGLGAILLGWSRYRHRA